jgi:hypothetical protein
VIRRRGPEAFMAVGLLSLYLVLAACKGCATTGTPDGGTTPVISVPSSCADTATHVAALDILGDVETALTSVSFSALLQGMIGTVLKDGVTVTADAVKCAVIEAVNGAASRFKASSDPLEQIKLKNGQAWLGAHP